MIKTEVHTGLTKMKKCIFYLVFLSIVSVVFLGCENNSYKKQKTKEQNTPIVAQFNADSAFNYIQRQVDFGPRVPGSAAHDKTAIYMTPKFHCRCHSQPNSFGQSF